MLAMIDIAPDAHTLTAPGRRLAGVGTRDRQHWRASPDRTWPTCEEDAMASADFESALDNTDEVELTVTGRVSGRQTSRPVWFIGASGTVWLLPVTGSATQWYKNVVNNHQIRLAAGAATSEATATPVTDSGRVAHVVEGFRAKYGARDVAAYYPNPDVAVEVSLG
jgi:hypothetical protein